MFNEKLCKVSELLNTNRLTLNIDKTVCVNFSTHPIPEKDTFIKLNNESLSYSRTVKCLGVILDESLTFKQYIQMTSDNVHKIFGILHRSSTCPSKNILIKLQYALVYPYLTYYSSLWGADSGTTLKTVLILQKRAV